MPIYERPTKTLLAEWARSHLAPGRVFDKSEPVAWFAQHYPKIKKNTVQMHMESMSVNNPMRRHFSNPRAGSGHDVFFKVGSNAFRLWMPDTDPSPRYKEDFEAPVQQTYLVELSEEAETETVQGFSASREFAFERDLKNYLIKSLDLIEPGLRIYEEEGITGLEFAVGGRFIDILAGGRDGCFVVIELKVSRGYDKVIGQLLRYMAWIKQNMDPKGPVRGVIVANNITDDLKLAASLVPNVQLIEYEIAFTLRAIETIK